MGNVECGSAAPTAVPANRCAQMGSDAPRADCLVTRVVIAAPSASGSPNKWATAVRAECVVDEGFSFAMISVRTRSIAK